MRNGNQVLVYDATLREGRQAPGVLLDVDGMVQMAVALDQFGVDVIEVGWPGANREWNEFFSRIASNEIPALTHAVYAAFGSTHRVGIRPENDPRFTKLIEAPVEIVTIFGKTWLVHVTDALRTTPEINLRMIEDSVRLLVKSGKRVFFDAEHFFQGVLKDGRSYGIEALGAAAAGGAEHLVLCDTNGIAMTWDVEEIVASVNGGFPAKIIGVHMHGDRGMSSANTVAAIRAGAGHFQGTINGYSERIRMAGTIDVLANLFLLISEGRLNGVVVSEGYKPVLSGKLSRLMDRLSGMTPDERQPFVSDATGSHKGGAHGDAVVKRANLYDSHDPSIFGVRRKIILSGMSGKSNILAVAKEQWVVDEVSEDAIEDIMSAVEAYERDGYRVDVCDGTAAVLVARQLWPHVETGWDHPARDPVFNSDASGTMATIVFEGSEPMTAFGSGPVDAMVRAVVARYRAKGQDALNVKLIRFGSANVDRSGSDGSASKVRVEIEWEHPEYGRFVTQGVTTNQDMSAWQAIQEAFEYVFYKDWNRQHLAEEGKEQ